MEKNSTLFHPTPFSQPLNSLGNKWNWIICNLALKQFVNGENITWSLQPSITLSHPSGEVKPLFLNFFHLIRSIQGP